LGGEFYIVDGKTVRQIHAYCAKGERLPILNGPAHFLEGDGDLPNFSVFFAGVYLISCPSLTTIEPIEGPVSSPSLYPMK
jgi:hypothetical protein